PFSPPRHAVWANGLWFLSLVTSITFALIAKLLQQCAQRCLKVTHSHKRIRLRSFSAEEVYSEKSTFPLVVETLRTLIHLSPSLFSAGLTVFPWNVDLTIFKLAQSWISAQRLQSSLLT
ncbi:hypothetical protein EI94DRAFT_1605886, partial [Lactarius quietus]